MPLFADYDSKLTGRNSTGRKLANNTYVERRVLNLAIRLHATDIISIQPDNTFIVNTGGWKTVTTKARLNEFLPRGFRVWQQKGEWFWATPSGGFSEKIPFTDGDKIVPDGPGSFKLVSQATPETSRQNAKLKKEIDGFAAGFMKALPIEMPGAGDCLYCQMARQNEGMAHDHGDHLAGHIKERYYVPSLLWALLKEAGAGPMYFGYCYKGPQQEQIARTFGDHFQKSIKRFIVRGLRRRLGLAK